MSPSPNSSGQRPSFHLDVTDEEEEDEEHELGVVSNEASGSSNAIPFPSIPAGGNAQGESDQGYGTQGQDLSASQKGDQPCLNIDNKKVPMGSTRGVPKLEIPQATRLGPGSMGPATASPTDGLQPQTAQKFSRESLYSYSYTYDANMSLSARLVALKRSIKFIMANPSLARNLQASLEHVSPFDARELPAKVFSTIRSSSTSLVGLANSFANQKSPSKYAADSTDSISEDPSDAVPTERVQAMGAFLQFLDDAISMLPEELNPHSSRISRASRAVAPGQSSSRRSFSRLGVVPKLQRSYSDAGAKADSPSTLASATASLTKSIGPGTRPEPRLHASAADLQDQLMNALTLPYMDVANPGYRLENGINGNMSMTNLSLSSNYTNYRNNNSSITSLNALSKSVSSLNLAPLATSTRKVPGQAFAITPLQPVSSKYALSHAIFTTQTQAPYRILSANDMACLLFGISQADVRSRSILSLVNRTYHTELVDQIAKQSQAEVTNPSSRHNVLICGQLLPTVKGNGAESVASVWLRSHHGCMVWVLEEVVADKLSIEFDINTGHVLSVTGDTVDLLVPQWTNYNVANARHVNSDRQSASDIDLGMSPTKSKNIASIPPNWNPTSTMEPTSKKTSHADATATTNTSNHNYTNNQTHSKNKSGVHLSDILGSEWTKLSPEALAQWAGEGTGLFEYCTLNARPNVVLPSLARLTHYDKKCGGIQVTSLPLMAGVVIVDSCDSSTFRITEYNHYFIGSLLGYNRFEAELKGHSVMEILPDFAELFQRVMNQCQFNQPDLSIGLVIPEQMFRRVSSVPTFSRGGGLFGASKTSFNRNAEAGSDPYHDFATEGRPARRASLCGPSAGPREATSDGMRAITVDGSVIHVDVQLRVISSNQYALWLSYSRAIHSFHSDFAVPSQLAMRNLNAPVAASPASDSGAEFDSFTAKVTGRPIAQKRTSVIADSDDVIEHDHIDVVKRRKPQEIGAQRRSKTLRDYEILQKLGEGAYGKVLLVRYPNVPYDVVIMKCVIKERILVDTWTRDKRLGTVPNEIRIMNTLNSFPHKNIVRLIDFFEDDDYYHIEMERHGNPGTDLFDLIELKPNMEESECRAIFAQVVSAIRHLHDQGIIHRDIKDENIVVDDAGTIKVIDFGSAAFVKQGPFDVFVGTIDYAAPEVLSGKPYDGRPQDVWALGILLYTIVYKENPFYNVDEIMDGELRIPFAPSAECLDLIRTILNRDVRARPSIHDICDHPWLKGAVTFSEETSLA